MTDSAAPLLVATDIKKSYGRVLALDGVSITVDAGTVTCLLGDNGAGKSTLIKILSGALHADAGTIELLGEHVSFPSPRAAIAAGIATVYQDLALVPVMPVYRNFMLGNEPAKGFWPFKQFDQKAAREITRRELSAIGIDLADTARPLATLSGGQRQCVAIARAVHFGAKILILDEPTSALGVRQSRIVLNYVAETSRRGVGVIFITHNPAHAHAVGDNFAILSHGRIENVWQKSEISADELLREMTNSRAVASLDKDEDVD